MNKLLEYLPELYHDIIEFVKLTETGEIEVLNAEQAIQRVFDDQFVMTASEQGIKRREKMLGIQADPTLESLDFRRKRIVNRYSTKPPFTIRYLQERLDYIIGEGRVIVAVNAQDFVLTVTASIDEAVVFREVEQTIKTVKPANMIYQQNTALEDNVCLEERISMQKIERQMRLGSTWQLGVTPFAIAYPEEVIK